MYDGIEFRGRSQNALETLARHADVPVWNGLTDLWHPTQAICDMLTVREHSTSHWPELTIAYLGDATSNVANSLRMTGSLLGMNVRIVSPSALRSSQAVVSTTAQICMTTGGTVMDTDDVDEGVRGADFLYTDVWVRIGEPAAQWSERVDLLRPYCVDREMLARTKNPEVKFMHCLPALHDGQTALGKEFQAVTGLDSAEVTDDVFESPASIVFDQAENRLHTIKALMVATLRQDGFVDGGSARKVSQSPKASR
jgi:ornithine carbamoyltransferase